MYFDTVIRISRNKAGTGEKLKKNFSPNFSGKTSFSINRKVDSNCLG